MIRVAVARSSIRMFSSGAWASAVVAGRAERRRPGRGAAAQTWYIGTVPGHRHRCSPTVPVTVLGRRPRRQDDRVVGRRPPGGLALALRSISMSREAVVVEVAPERRPRRPSGPGPGRAGCRAARAPRPGSRSWASRSVWPDHRPWRLSVGSNVSDLGRRRGPSSPADERARSPSRRGGRRASRRSMRRDDRALVVGRRPGAGVEAARRRAGRPSSQQRRERRRPAAGPRSAASDGQARVGVVAASSARPARARRCPCRRPTTPGGRARSSSPPSISAASASRRRGRRSSSASSALLPVSSWPSTR